MTEAPLFGKEGGFLLDGNKAQATLRPLHYY